MINTPTKEMLEAEKKLQKEGFRFVTWLGSEVDWSYNEGEMLLKRSKSGRHEYRTILMSGKVC